MMNACDQENSRRVLVGIVEGAIARVKVKAAEAQERAERDAARRADCLSFDGSHEGELLRRYLVSNHRQFIRSLNEFVKIRRAADEILGEPELQVDERVQHSEEDGRGESDADWSRGDHPAAPMGDDADWQRRDQPTEPMGDDAGLVAPRPPPRSPPFARGGKGLRGHGVVVIDHHSSVPRC